MDLCVVKIKKWSLSVLFFATTLVGGGQTPFVPFAQAKKHPLTYDRPAPDFFEGALLGNGAMGVVLTTRPDAVVLYFGHNNVWDVRIAEKNKEKIGTFQEVFEKVNAIPETLKMLTDDAWYREYSEMAGENYSKPYPRPFPCGRVLLGFDPRHFEVTGHKLDISSGLCEVYFLSSDKQKKVLQVFTQMTADRLWFRLVDLQGNPVPNFFDRIRVIPDPSTPKEFPSAQYEEALDAGVLAFRQTLLSQESDCYNASMGHSKDKAFRLTALVNCQLGKSSRINWDGIEQRMAPLEASMGNQVGFTGCVSLEEGLDVDIMKTLPQAPIIVDNRQFSAFRQESIGVWAEYWGKSGVRLEDQFLERMWYHNLYFLNCAAKDGVATPGLFANWSYNNIGTAWHGDYHMNYNTQQPFWVTFSSNHLEKNLSYVSLIEHLMPVSKLWAQEYYGLPGAYFPHSAFPVEMTMNPYPVPTWGWEICETPWAIQGLWWHYLYSGDLEFLKTRGYEPIKAAVEFLVAYMTRLEAFGPQWGDDKYHIFPTVPPELYGLRPGFQYNYDCNADLALTKFAFKAFVEATEILGYERREKSLLSNVKKIMSRFPDYPTAPSVKYGKVFVSVPEEHDQVVYNVPLPLFSIFPGEDHGLHSDSKTLEMLRGTYLNQQNEGGNDLVLANLQAARVGLLDLERFKRQVNYCLQPNGTASDRVTQVHGRYGDDTGFGYMDKMGVWFENFGLPVVVNECLMQSYNGTVRLFPNWPRDQDAEFQNLRAVGAFLVSASLREGVIHQVNVVSERGNVLTILNPWPSGVRIIRASSQTIQKGKVLRLSTKRGEMLTLQPE